MSPEVKGQQQLRAEVIDRGLCALCGACVGMCPYLVAHRGRVVALDDCAVEQGRCHAFCPRTATDLGAVSNAVFGAPFDASPIGRAAEVLIARAAREDVRSKAQYGGAVSVLVAFAIERGFIDSSVLTRSDSSMLPAGVLVRDADDVLAHAGSNYAAAPTLAAFNREAGREDIRSIGVVATPCQALALAKMRLSPLENRNHIEKLSLVIGLFCTWALDYRDFAPFLAKKVSARPHLEVRHSATAGQRLPGLRGPARISFPLDEVRRFIRPACNVCLDMTAEFADVSVGAAEGIEGWNTLIVRTNAGGSWSRLHEGRSSRLTASRREPESS